jgi:cell division transport system permease protein
MMAQDNTIRRRLTASYLTSVVSISLVLFMVGLVGMLLLNTKKLSDYVKENVGISIYLNDDIREVDQGESRRRFSKGNGRGFC